MARHALPDGAASAAATIVLLALGAGVAGCSAGTGAPAPTSLPSAATSAPRPSGAPEPTPSGQLLAELRQSSRDAAAQQLQVWVLNDTATEVTPRTMSLLDRRWDGAVAGERLRGIPPGRERGFPLPLPARVRCGEVTGPRRSVLRLDLGDVGTRRVVTADPNGLVAAHRSARCQEEAVAAIARLTWSDRVVRHADGTADLRLRVTPVARSTSDAGPDRLRLLTVGGTPVLTPAGSAVWRPQTLVRPGDRPSTLLLRVRPARCDPHAFAESAGATAFRVRVALDGAPAELTLRMGETAMARTLAYAVAACGL